MNLIPQNDLEWAFFFGCAWTVLLVIGVPLMIIWSIAIFKKYKEVL